ncbi:hypothetical protein ACYOEI_17615 [Singulisphaera rosea]
MSREKEPESMWMKPSEAIDIFYPLCMTLSTCFYPFLHSHFGTHAFAWYGPFALVLMFVWIGFAEAPELTWFMGAWLLMIIYRRIWCTERDEISTYTGDPVVAMKLPFINTASRGRFVEPLLVAGAGAGIESYSKALSVFFLFGAAAMALVAAFDRQMLSRRMREMRDAALYHEHMGRMFRGRR